MSIEHIRLSQQARDQLVKLKRWTGLANWNVLCRLGLAVSLAEPTIPPQADIPADSNVEMTWRVFGGVHADIYMALIRNRCIQDGFNPDSNELNNQLRLHLHRGIGYLAGDRNIRSIIDLTRKICDTRTDESTGAQCNAESE